VPVSRKRYAAERWDPVTGEMRDLPEFKAVHGQTSIPMEFAPRQSLFVVFRKPVQSASQKKGRENFPVTEMAQQFDGSWQVSFDPKWGGPKEVTFDKLQDWIERPEEGIRYYSGTATYRKTFDLPAGAEKERLFLDLGVVNYLAAVRLKWKRPGSSVDGALDRRNYKGRKGKRELSGVRYCESLDKLVDWRRQTSSCKPVYKNQCCAGSGMVAASFRPSGAGHCAKGSYMRGLSRASLLDHNHRL
jgi:hypothetical protein